MAFLDRIFRRDPRQTLEKAEGWLSNGQGVRALHAAEDVAAKAHDDDPLKEKAENLVGRAHEAIMTRALEEAKLSKGVGDWKEAADWLGTARDHCRDPAQRQEIEALMAALQEKANEAERVSLEVVAEKGEEPVGDDEIAYEMLIASFSPEVMELYQERSADFRQAVVTFHSGDAEAALEVLEELLEESPEDPVLHLEAGQARLALGRTEEAQKDFEAVEETFGEASLDAADRLSVPILLATAMLEGGRPEALLEHFEGRVDPADGPRELVRLWARALGETGREEEALDAYLALGNRFPADAEVAEELAALLQEKGHDEEAIARLERVVAPCCSTGSCRKGNLSLPASRRLVGLYLEDARNPQRAGEILAWILVATGGRLFEADAPLVEKYQELIGEDSLPAPAELVGEGAGVLGSFEG